MHRMDMRSREQYLKALLGRYLRVRKRGKSALLDEYCRNTGMARKSVLRKIAGLLKGESPPRKRRRPVYGRPVRVALETLWEIFDRPCGQRLKPLVEEELGRLCALGEIEVDEKTARCQWAFKIHPFRASKNHPPSHAKFSSSSGSRMRPALTFSLSR